MTVPEDERKFSGINRNLIEDVSVIAVQRLTRGIGAGGRGMSAEANRAAGAFGTDFINGMDATVFAGGRDGAAGSSAGSAALATFVVPPNGANATARAVSNRLVSLP